MSWFERQLEKYLQGDVAISGDLSVGGNSLITTPAQWSPTYGVSGTSGTISYNTTVSNTVYYTIIAGKIGILSGRWRFTLTGSAGGSASYVTMTLPFTVHSSQTSSPYARGTLFSAVTGFDPSIIFVAGDQVTLNVGISPDVGGTWAYNESNGQVHLQHAFLLA